MAELSGTDLSAAELTVAGASGDAITLEEITSTPVPLAEAPNWRHWGIVGGAVAVVVIGVVVALSLSGGGNPPASPPDAPDAAAVKKREDDLKKAREDGLRGVAEHHLKESGPNPAGVDACIELGVFYLEENRVGDAEALFQRMRERRAQAGYHFVGRLGLALTDAVKGDERGAGEPELF